MKRLINLVRILTFVILVCLVTGSVKAAKSTIADISNAKTVINSINGQVFDPYNNPLSDLNVELQSETYSTIARTRTTGGGRFTFIGISAGSFKVKVLTLGTNYLEETQDVQIVELTQGSSDSAYVDFHLKFDPRRITLGLGGVPEAVFVQEGVTNEARRHYEKGVEQLANKKDKGLVEIEQALQISPNYFQALNRLGQEYVVRKEYQKSLPYLIKAIDVNQRSFSSFYALGYACYQLNHIPEAVEAARATTIITPDSFNAQLLYGTVLRINGNYDKAEKSLLEAKKLSKNPSPEVHWQLALLYNKTDRNKEAVDALETYLKISPNSPNKQEIQDLIAKLRKSITTAKGGGL
jgi:tetratricopeptide (TPR) repeat protein